MAEPTAEDEFFFRLVTHKEVVPLVLNPDRVDINCEGNLGQTMMGGWRCYRCGAVTSGRDLRQDHASATSLIPMLGASTDLVLQQMFDADDKQKGTSDG